MHCLSQHRTRHLLRPAPAQWALQSKTGSFISSLTGIFIWAELTPVSRQAFRNTSPLSFSHEQVQLLLKERRKRKQQHPWLTLLPGNQEALWCPWWVCVPSTCYQPFHTGFLAAELMPSLENWRICGSEMQPYEELCMGSTFLVLLMFSSNSTPGWPLNTAISRSFGERECYSSQIHSKTSFLRLFHARPHLLSVFKLLSLRNKQQPLFRVARLMEALKRSCLSEPLSSSLQNIPPGHHRSVPINAL